ncbi:hypothetical protein QBC37DRAFT_373527 [Rhypophila decipiens]|uniref:Uncharacterized protein n=1 Tax=Rhypophila decipiens TaxID=261697 RepID=A0AAN6Y9L2_9PEZI|nr:hypothetical protein QBC37DRAFT_373527 [Rhypophila decipiens]
MVQTTVDKPPKCHLPMSTAGENNELTLGESRTSSVGAGRPSPIVTKQPSPEPAPKMENEMTLRGGRMSLGFNCCGGHCAFNKGCC